MTDLPAPITLTVPAEPDADYETLRARALAVVTELASATWTDHNASDPGVTLLEAAVFGVADLHYRTAAATPLADWPLAAPMWLPPPDRVPSRAPMPEEPARARAIADALRATLASRAAVRAVERASGVGEAAAALLGPALAPADAAVAVGLLRRRLVLRAGLDGSHLVAEAIERAARVLGASAPQADLDARAIEILRLDPRARPLWDEELRALLRGHRRAAVLGTARAHAAAVRSARSPADLQEAGAALVAAGLAPAEAEQALSLHPCPPGRMPEDPESASGETLVWPPTPIQALTCEPVTAGDYARRARTHPEVGRAWTVPGVLPGVGWDGREVAAAADRPGAITLVVERAGGAGTDLAFLRSVLETVIGPGLAAPFDYAHGGASRRLTGDEVGAAKLRICPVQLQGTIHAALDADRSRLLADARAAVARFLADGRAESRAPEEALACPQGVNGPWPPAPQPEGGWVPGDPIRISELVQVLTGVSGVLGVSELKVSVSDGPFLPEGSSGAEQVAIGRGCVPGLATTQCLRVRLGMDAECAGG